MSNNHSIKVLRGTRDHIVSATSPANRLYAGQLLYNLTDNYLTVGGNADGSTDSAVTKLPIIVREVKGYSADNSAIVGTEGISENSSWHFGHDGSSSVEVSAKGLPLKVLSNDAIDITATDPAKDVTISSGNDIIIMGGNGDRGKITIGKDGDISLIRGTDYKITVGTSEVDLSANTGKIKLTANGATVGSGNSKISIPTNGDITVSCNGDTVAIVSGDGITLYSGKFVGDLTGNADSSTKVKIGSVPYSFVLTDNTSGSDANTIYFVY